MQTPAQTTSQLLMIRPSHFGFNEQTAESNAFQSKTDSLTAAEISQKAVEEFDALVCQIRKCGVEVTVIEDDPDLKTPDSVFPNNWISFHENGTILLYPMQSEIRRRERRQKIIDQIARKFQLNATFSLTHSEDKQQFLEGTGSMVLDRVNRKAYACLSPRTHPSVLEQFCKLMKYEGISFRAVDDKGKEIYHTNVMMTIGESFAIYTPEAIPNPIELFEVKRCLEDCGKALIPINLDQMKSFAGNMLQLCNDSGETFLFMSSQAFRSLNTLQISQIENHTQIVHSPINVIEQTGGGSVRCMMAEIFLKPKK